MISNSKKLPKETLRYSYFNENDNNNNTIEIGIDEVGRGSLISRIYAAAVILPNYFLDDKWKEIKDSKKLSAKKRAILCEYIEQHCIYSIQWAEVEEIDQYNILNATMIAMNRCVNDLLARYPNYLSLPIILLVDGNQYKVIENPVLPSTSPNNFQPQVINVINGDNLYISIAAASILAKTHRDKYIDNLVHTNPQYQLYGWENNKGYGTKEHLSKIQEHGITIHHRKSFNLTGKSRLNKRKMNKIISEEFIAQIENS